MKEDLIAFNNIWNNKPVLREVYTNYFEKIKDSCVNGLTLEIGGGSGNLKDYLGNIISTDIQYASWIDVVGDAQFLPFDNDSIDNIVLLDVLHHIQYPKLFFKEASRVLKSKGRIILLEPGITPVSRFFYSYFHHESVDMNADPLSEGKIKSNRNPYDSNQAIPTLLFGKYKSEFEKIFLSFKFVEKKFFSLLAYPLSGGFKKWSLISKNMVPLILKLEDKLIPLLGKFMGFRLFIIIEKK